MNWPSTRPSQVSLVSALSRKWLGATSVRFAGLRGEPPSFGEVNFTAGVAWSCFRSHGRRRQQPQGSKQG